MVAFYIASNIYLQTIQSVLREKGIMVSGQEVSDEFYLLKFVKSSAISRLSSADEIVIDLEACQDHDDDIITALETLRTLNDRIRIIILAANRYEGDELLTRCFHLGIWDIIQSSDYAVIRSELSVCVTVGKSFKEASVFKDFQKDKPILRQEIKRVVNKVMVGIAGTQSRIGTTHQAIVLANALRKRGFMAAVAECNGSGAFMEIREGFGESMIDGRYFSLNGVDYYPAADSGRLAEIISKSYNFVIADFGCYTDCDLVTYHKSEIKLLICGSRPWELSKINQVFERADRSVLDTMNFCFNFVTLENRQSIMEGMDGVGSVHFLPFTDDPFYADGFPDLDYIFHNYMPKVLEPEKKRRWFRR